MHGEKDILYGSTSFRLHRIPYQVLMLCPPIPPLWQNVRDPALPKHPTIKEILGTPLHVLVTDRKDRRTSRTVQTHLVESHLPPGAIVDSPLGTQACSPLFTLLTLARHLGTIELAMAMYEFCGRFSVFKPTPVIEDLLRTPEAVSLSLSNRNSWKRVGSTTSVASGVSSSLWMRPPLISLDELHGFARQCPHFRGRKRFEQAAKLVTGVTSSPFEVQLSMLLSLPEKLGGKGISDFSNNEKIHLSKNARSIYGYENVYADLFFAGDEMHKPLDVECQGAIIHNDNERALSDADRATALATMDIETLWVTYRQMASIDDFQTVAELICRKIGSSTLSTDWQSLWNEHELRRVIMCDWAKLGGY